MNKYRVIITEPNGKKGKRFEKVYEVPYQASVIDYLLYDSPLIHDLQDSEVSIHDINLEVYFESQIEIDQEPTIIVLQKVAIERMLNVDYLKKAIFDSLNEIGLTYDPREPLPKEIKGILIQLLSNNL